jgi:hypothetical protein
MMKGKGIQEKKRRGGGVEKRGEVEDSHANDRP